MEARGARDTVAIGEGEGLMTLIDGSLDQVFRVARGFEEGKSASSAKFDVILGILGGRHALFSSYFRHESIVYLAHSLVAPACDDLPSRSLPTLLRHFLK